MRRLVSLTILLTVLFSGNLFAISERRVLIMDIKNVSGDPNYAYLEPSITEAVTKTLRKSFVFLLFEEKEWKALAKKNFFFEDSFHTPTIGMQLGLLGRQDIVIGGGFTIQGNKIIAKIHILGMADKTILKAFDIEGYADNRIWDSVQKIADTIAEVAKDVLPNKEEWNSYSVQGRNQISLSGFISPFGFPDARTTAFPSGSAFQVYPHDFAALDNTLGLNAIPMIKFSAEYMRIGLGLDNLTAWGNFSYATGSRDFPAEGHDSLIPVGEFTNTISGKIEVFHVSAGLGYRLFSIQSFYIMPRIGAGFYMSTLTLDFTHLTNPPSSIAGDADVTILSTPLTGVSANADLVLGYQLFEWLTVELMTQYQHVFFAGETYSSNIYFALNLGIKF